MNQSQLIKRALDEVQKARLQAGSQADGRVLDLVISELRDLHAIAQLGYIRRPAAPAPPAPPRNVIDEINSEIEKLIDLVARMEREHTQAMRFGDRMHDRAVKLAGGDPLVSREFEG